MLEIFLNIALFPQISYNKSNFSLIYTYMLSSVALTVKCDFFCLKKNYRELYKIQVYIKTFVPSVEYLPSNILQRVGE